MSDSPSKPFRLITLIAACTRCHTSFPLSYRGPRHLSVSDSSPWQLFNHEAVNKSFVDPEVKVGPFLVIFSAADVTLSKAMPESDGVSGWEIWKIHPRRQPAWVRQVGRDTFLFSPLQPPFGIAFLSKHSSTKFASWIERGRVCKSLIKTKDDEDEWMKNFFFSEKHFPSCSTGIHLAQSRKNWMKTSFRLFFLCGHRRRVQVSERRQFHLGGNLNRYHRATMATAPKISTPGDGARVEETREGTGAREMKKATIQNIQDLHLYSTTRWILKIEIRVGGESGRKEANSVSQNLWLRCTPRPTSCLRIFIDAFSGACLRGPARVFRCPVNVGRTRVLVSGRLVSALKLVRSWVVSRVSRSSGDW